MPRVNYEVPRLFKLHEDARRCSKDFQQVWYELEMFKVCHDDMPCEVHVARYRILAFPIINQKIVKNFVEYLSTTTGTEGTCTLYW